MSRPGAFVFSVMTDFPLDRGKLLAILPEYRLFDRAVRLECEIGIRFAFGSSDLLLMCNDSEWFMFHSNSR